MTRRERLEAKIDKREEWAAGRRDKAATLRAYGGSLRHDWAFITQPGHIPERARMVQAFAERMEREQRTRLAREYPNLPLETDHYRVAVHVGPKYTRVDFGGSGKYMVVNATGQIFGIKAYGVIHRGHAYGTLDTIDAWDWSGYAVVKRS